MHSGGVSARSYAVEDQKILFVTDVGGMKDMFKVKKFVLEQPETKEFEWNQQKSAPHIPPLSIVPLLLLLFEFPPLSFVSLLLLHSLCFCRVYLIFLCVRHYPGEQVVNFEF